MEPGIGDSEVLDTANCQHAVLLTVDKDFGELVYRRRMVHHGVILLRLQGLPPWAKAELVAHSLARGGIARGFHRHYTTENSHTAPRGLAL